MENTVEIEQGIVLDDAALEPAQEETPVEKTSEEPKQEPGYVKYRIDKAVQKALQEQEQRLRAEFDQTLAPIRESMMERQADELVESGEFKSKERALEYLKLKGGVPIEETPRDERGRFTKNEDPVIQARADLLAKQADKIKANRGLDVMAVFNDDPDVKQRILSGEWDFYDVADAMKKNPPAPMRSPNGIGVNAMSIQNMTDEQFKKLQANLANGRKYDMRK